MTDIYDIDLTLRVEYDKLKDVIGKALDKNNNPDGWVKRVVIEKDTDGLFVVEVYRIKSYPEY